MRILLGMSGGLDSTYAARLLLDAGHEVEAAVLRMHEETDLAAARESADVLGIRLQEVDCRARFEACVIEPFCRAYQEGMTPNPCVLCNPAVKFGVLYEQMLAGGFDRMATGHYAQIREEGGRYAVCLSEDSRKDQSYVLYRLPQEVLSHLLFPLGGYGKEAVRAEARARGYAAAERAESMEICFVPPGRHAAYVAARCGESPAGEFVDGQGRVLGMHRGLPYYTVGQRKGLGIACGERMFVRRMDAGTNRIELSPEAACICRTLTVRDLVFSGQAPCTEGVAEYSVRLRYRAPLLPARVCFTPTQAEVTLLTPAKFAAPGQSAVFYRGDRVAFGGIIAGGSE